MTEQLKAEAYVRSQRPALLERGLAAKSFITRDGTKLPILNNINLQDWMAVLVNHCEQINYIQLSGTNYITFMANRHPYKTLLFNLTTGQPATESDYQSFNEIVSV